MALANLAKLKILVEDEQGKFGENDPIEVLFNPNQITFQKSAAWKFTPAAEKDTPKAQFTHGESANLTTDLFFDTYETGTDVRDHTDKIYHLTTVEQHGNKHRPPICKLLWGTFDFNDFKWVLQAVNQRFTLFLENGTPVRATLGCTFKQWRSDEEDEKRMNKESADVPKTRTVRRGDSLSSIAGEEYRDPTLWRPIAEANSIDDPFSLTPGQMLAIPALRSRRATR